MSRYPQVRRIRRTISYKEPASKHRTIERTIYWWCVLLSSSYPLNYLSLSHPVAIAVHHYSVHTTMAHHIASLEQSSAFASFLSSALSSVIFRIKPFCLLLGSKYRRCIWTHIWVDLLQLASCITMCALSETYCVWMEGNMLEGLVQAIQKQAPQTFLPRHRRIGLDQTTSTNRCGAERRLMSVYLLSAPVYGIRCTIVRWCKLEKAPIHANCSRCSAVRCTSWDCEFE